MNARAGYIALFICLILVAARVVIAAQSTMAVRIDTGAGAGSRLTDPLITKVKFQDSLLAVHVDHRRDPFRPWNPPTTSAAPRPGTTAVVPAQVVPPRVAVFMQDGSSVIIQIEVDGHTSPRLPIGGSFRGWTIAGASGNSITLTKDGRSFSVPRP